MPNALPKIYDAFLSYNSKDHPAVVVLAERLKGEKLALYLDEWDLTPGGEFQVALAEALRDSKTCVVFLGTNGLAPWQKQEIMVAIDRRTHDDSFRVIPVLLPGTQRPRRGDVAHLEFLINASWVEFLDTLDDGRAFNRLVWGITGREPPLEAKFDGGCPYRGLEAFRPEDERFFFGRQKLTDWLVSALRREVREKGQGVRFLGVIGPSGSGKSSVVLAGLVPKLRSGEIEGSEDWPVVITRPGDDPVGNLAAGVVPALRDAGALLDIDSVRKLIGAIYDEDEARALARTAQLALHDRPANVQLVVVVDQFEELFTYQPQDETARQRFERARTAYLANLLNAAAAPGGRVTVVLTMRSDFLGNCAGFPQLSAVLSARQELVGPMTPAELREAIVQPAFLIGHEVEPALVERLLADVEGQKGALPLLQFALTEVWKKRDVRRLTLRAYQELGKDERGNPSGIQGALEHRANEIYDNLTEADRDLCRRIFLRLVQPGEGTEDTKRRVSFRELLPADAERADAVRNLIHMLSERDARLITTEGAGAADGWVEVAHEALIQGWTQLRRWVDADRAGLRTQRRLSEAAHEWASSDDGNKEGYLYKGTPLAICQDWAAAHPDELGSVEVEFLAASEQAERKHQEAMLEHERRLRQAAEERRRDAEAAAIRQKRLGRRFQAAAVVGGVLAIVAGGSAFLANSARHDADLAAIGERKAAKAAKENERKATIQSDVADSRRIAAQSEQLRSSDLDLSLILAVEALGIADTDEARMSLFGAIGARPGLTCLLHNRDGHAKSLAFSPDGQTLVLGHGGPGGGGGADLWDVARHGKLAELPPAATGGSVLGATFSPDGQTIAGVWSVDGRGTLVLWDVKSRQKLIEMLIPLAPGERMHLAFSPDGQTLAVGCVGGLALWDVDRRGWSPARLLELAEGWVGGVVFSSDGLYLGASYQDNRGASGVMVWQWPSQKLLADWPLAIGEGVIWSVAFSPDSKILAAGYGVPNEGGGVVLWDRTRDQRLTEPSLRVAEGEVMSVMFSPDGNALAAGYGGRGGVGGVVFFDAAQPKRLIDEPLSTGAGYVESIAFSPDGKTLAVAHGGSSGVVELRGARRRLAVPEGAVTGVAFSPRGDILAISYSSGAVLWDPAKREPLPGKRLTVEGEDLSGVTFSPDGKLLAARYSGGLVVWNVNGGAPLVNEKVPATEGLGQSVAFSPDSGTLAVGYDGGWLLYDLNQRKWRKDQSLSDAGGDVMHVAFSPDGRRLAAGCKLNDGSAILLRDLADSRRRVEKPLPLSGGDLTSIGFSPDGKTLAVGCNAGVVLWDVDRREWTTHEPLAIPEGLVGTVAFSPDGKTLAAGVVGGQKGRVVLWDVALQRRRSGIPPPPLLGAKVTSVAFSPDGKIAAVGSEFSTDVEMCWLAEDRKLARDHVGGQVALWSLDLEDYLNQARIIANRNLTRDEWSRLFFDRPYHATFEELEVPPRQDGAP